jgi:hypothetical protein
MPTNDTDALIERLCRLLFDGGVEQLPRLRPRRIGWHWPRRRLQRWEVAGAGVVRAEL